MLFNSVDFMLFFPIVLLIYFIVPKKIRYIWLLAASYYFYMNWNPVYVLLLLGVTAITYVCSIFIGKIKTSSIKKHSIRKVFLCGGIVINLIILFYYKYFGFLIENLNRLFAKINIHTLNAPDIILPVGISFFTFQALGYLIDVYKGEIDPEYNFFKYALFVSFFPQLVAGPIERSKNLLTQIQNDSEHHMWNYNRVISGFVLMLWGFFVKMVIADRAAISVDYIFANYERFGFVELSAGAVLFAIQIYCDFGGYSYIAIGAAKVLDYELMDNFKTPYLSVSISEFWRRWHISLSQWLRDYIYIPLGGSRCGRAKHYRNLLITFGISGIWHGANWTYIVWGVLHGIYQICEKMMAKPMEWIHLRCHTKKECFGYKLFCIIITFVATDIAWIFFRASTLSQACGYIRRLLIYWNPWKLLDGTLYSGIGLSIQESHILFFAILIMTVMDILQIKKEKNIYQLLENQWIVFRYVVVLGLLWGIILLGCYGVGTDTTNFIYFQF